MGILVDVMVVRRKSRPTPAHWRASLVGGEPCSSPVNGAHHLHYNSFL
jgi:hypothetical protein